MSIHRYTQKINDGKWERMIWALDVCKELSTLTQTLKEISRICHVYMVCRHCAVYFEDHMGGPMRLVMMIVMMIIMMMVNGGWVWGRKSGWPHKNLQTSAATTHRFCVLIVRCVRIEMHTCAKQTQVFCCLLCVRFSFSFSFIIIVHWITPYLYRY